MTVTLLVSSKHQQRKPKKGSQTEGAYGTFLQGPFWGNPREDRSCTKKGGNVVLARVSGRSAAPTSEGRVSEKNAGRIAVDGETLIKGRRITKIPDIKCKSGQSPGHW